MEEAKVPINPIQPKEVKKITLWTILGWAIGGFFVVVGFVGLFSDFLFAFFMILSGIVILPPFGKFVKQKFNIELSKAVRVVIFIVLFLIGAGTLSSSKKDTKSNDSTNNSPSNQQPAQSSAPNSNGGGTVIGLGLSAKKISGDLASFGFDFNDIGGLISDNPLTNNQRKLTGDVKDKDSGNYFTFELIHDDNDNLLEANANMMFGNVPSDTGKWSTYIEALIQDIDPSAKSWVDTTFTDGFTKSAANQSDYEKKTTINNRVYDFKVSPGQGQPAFGYADLTIDPNSIPVTDTQPSAAPLSESDTNAALWKALDQIDKGNRDGWNIIYSQANNPGVVTLTQTSDSFWDEQMAVNGAINTSISYGYQVFKIPGIDQEIIEFKSTFTDNFGNKSVEDIIKIGITKDKFNRYNWQNLNYEPIYNQMIQSADPFDINPSVKSKINTDQLTLDLNS